MSSSFSFLFLIFFITITTCSVSTNSQRKPHERKRLHKESQTHEESQQIISEGKSQKEVSQQPLRGHHGDGEEMTCDSSFYLSCDEIKQLPLLQFLGAGWHKATYLTTYQNQTLVLRVASLPGEFGFLNEKERQIRERWLRFL